VRLQAAPEQWLEELTDGSVHRGVATIAHAPLAQPPLLSNKYAHLAVAFRQELTPTPPTEDTAAEAGEPENGLAAAAKTVVEANAAAAAAVMADEEAEVLDVAPLEAQEGDDWLHLAALAQWQRLRTARVA